MKRLIFPLVLLVLITAVVFVSCGKTEPQTETMEETATVEITSSTAIKTTSTAPKQSTTIPTHSSVVEGGYIAMSGLANPSASFFSLGLPPIPNGPVATPSTTTAARTTTTTTTASTTTAPTATTAGSGDGSGTPGNSSSSATVSTSINGAAGNYETPVMPFFQKLVQGVYAIFG